MIQFNFKPTQLRRPFIATLVAVLILGAAGVAAASNEHYQKGLRLSQQELWADAAEEFKIAAREEPNAPLNWANLGVAYSGMDQHKEALLAYDKAQARGYDNAFFRYNRGVSFLHLNLLDEAEEEMLKALNLDPRFSKATYNLGLIYSRRGEHKKAFKQVDKLYYKSGKLAKKLFSEIPPPYKIAATGESGKLTGRISLSGEKPRARSFHLIHAPNIKFCSRISDGKGHRLLFDFTVSENHDLKDAVVAILGVKKGKAFSQPGAMQSFNIRRCHSDKYVIGVNRGENILLENFDPIRHEIATYEFQNPRVRQKSNKPVLANSSQVRSALVHSDTREFVIKCNLHPFLQTRGLMVENPYYAITDAQGRFSIDGVPPGTYEVMAWHPFIPLRKGTATIAPNGETKIDFEFESKDIRRKLYQDDLEGYRFQPWYDSFENFYGGPRIDDEVEVLQKF